MTTVSMLLGNVSSGYAVNNSLRFRSSASAYLNRTFGSPTNAIKWTWSAWVKLGALTVNRNLFTAASTGTANIQLQNDNTLTFYQYNSGYQYNRTTTQVFRDPSAWYHIVAVYDSANATASNRVLLYINGAQITSFSSSTDPSLNYAGYFNASGQSHVIGGTSGAYFDGYITEVNFIDGQALTPSSFGTYDTNGVWQPINYSGSYGTNGFHLTFGNTTSTTTLGYDTSGNSNNWTTNNISLTAGSTYDSMTDSPTVTSASVANYAVLNPLMQRWAVNASVFANGNLNVSTSSGSTAFAFGTQSVSSGKYYWETTITAVGSNTPAVGVATLDAQNTVQTNIVVYLSNGQKQVGGTSSAYGATYTTGDVIGIALDCGGGTITFYKNNTSQGAISLVTSSNLLPHIQIITNASITANFGQQPFTYTPPTGFNALNTYNLPTPTIANGAQYMAATLYTGNNVDGRSITNGGNNTIGTTFQPDFVWVKDRTSATYWNVVFDSVRGAGNQLATNVTDAELASASNVAGKVSAFNSNGFSLGKGSSVDFNGLGSVNGNGENYVGWQWKANGTGVSNTNGSITSTVSANTTAGFSVATYTGNGSGSGATIGHGLGVAPSMIIAKSRSATGDWPVYHISLGATGGVYLDLTNAFGSSQGFWNNTSPTSSVFSVYGSNANASGVTFVAYCWAAVAGYSAFGSYTGNGSTDGPFCYTGFRPRWIMFKRSDSTGAWNIFDTSRDTYNVESAELSANSSAAEGSVVTLDGLSNGFKIRNSSASDTNANGGTYVYAAFAETPFNYSRGR